MLISWNKTVFWYINNVMGVTFGFDERNPCPSRAITQWSNELKNDQTKNANAWKSLLKRAELVKAYA